MRRVIGMDIHRTFAEVFWEEGRFRPGGRVNMTRSGLEGFARSLSTEDEIVVEATGNAMGVVRVLSPYVPRTARGWLSTFYWLARGMPRFPVANSAG